MGRVHREPPLTIEQRMAEMRGDDEYVRHAAIACVEQELNRRRAYYKTLLDQLETGDVWGPFFPDGRAWLSVPLPMSDEDVKIWVADRKRQGLSTELFPSLTLEDLKDPKNPHSPLYG